MKRIASAIFALFLLGELASPAQDSCVAGQSLSLQECIQIASSDNVTVKNSHLDYMSAKMRRREALAYYFPTVDIKAMGFNALNPLVRIGISDILGSSDLANNIKYNVETAAGLSGINTTYETLSQAYGAALTLMQPIYVGGKIVNSNRLADLGVQAADLNESIAKRDIVTEIERKYTLVVSLEEKMKMVECGLAFAEKLYEDVSSAYASGLVVEDDRKKVESGRHDLQVKKIRLKGGIMLARMDLCNAMGIDCSQASGLYLSDRMDDCSSPDTYYMDPSKVVESMEESRLLELAVEQKKLEKKIAMSDALPQIGLGASYSYGRLIGSPQTNGSVYAMVKIPITDWSKVANKMKSIDYQMEKAVNQREYLSSMLELQLRQCWVEVESTWEELCLKEEEVDYARDRLKESQADVSAGLSTISTLMERQLELSKAECEEIDARIAYRNAVATFQSKCGQK